MTLDSNDSIKDRGDPHPQKEARVDIRGPTEILTRVARQISFTVPSPYEGPYALRTMGHVL